MHSFQMATTTSNNGVELSVLTTDAPEIDNSSNDPDVEAQQQQPHQGSTPPLDTTTEGVVVVVVPTSTPTEHNNNNDISNTNSILAIAPTTSTLDDPSSNSIAERRRIVRTQVLASIFPARKEGESLQFDAVSGRYVVVLDATATAPELVVPAVSPTSSSSSSSEDNNNNSDSNDTPDTTLQSPSSDDPTNTTPPPLICSICLEPITGAQISTAMCSHVYHSDCLLAWAHRAHPNHNNCPTCRRPLWDAQVYRKLEQEVMDRLGYDASSMLPPTTTENHHPRFLTDEEFYEPEGVMVQYIRRFLPLLCCILVLLFFSQALLPNVALSGKHWW